MQLGVAVFRASAPDRRPSVWSRSARSLAMREAQARLGRKPQVDWIGPHVEQVLLDGSYEIIEELAP